MGWMSVQPQFPPDRDSTLLGRERAIFCDIGGELMEHHGHSLSSFRTQHNFGAGDFGIVAHGIRRELATDELCQRYSQRQTGTQQLVRCYHRANPSLKRIHETAD